MAALAEILDAGLHELAWSEWVWLLLNTKSGAIIAEFRDALSGAPFQENPANREGQIGAQAQLFPVRVGKDIGARAKRFADAVKKQAGGLNVTRALRAHSLWR